MSESRKVTRAQQRAAIRALHENRRKLKGRGLDKTLADLRQFNEKYDLNLSYGQYIAAIKFGGQ